MENTQDKIQQVRNIIKNANAIVCYIGVGMAIECGYPNIWSDEMAYYIEGKYRHSIEEFLSAAFFSTRTDLFYECYKNEILKYDYEPSEGHKAIFELHKMGKLRACITQSIQGIATRAGIPDVVELMGSLHENKCPKCGRRYNAEYVMESNGVPHCEDCRMALRPGIILKGELLNNNIMTQAADACQGADVLLILGTNLYDDTVKSFINYYKGKNLILISKNEHFTDRHADIVINEEVQIVLPQVV